MVRFGRRTLYLGGLIMLFMFLFIVSFIALAHTSSSSTSWATGSMLFVYTFVYDSTVSPVCYSLVAELSSSRLRTRTIVISRNLYNVVSIVNGVIIPYMLNSEAWNWRAKPVSSGEVCASFVCYGRITVSPSRKAGLMVSLMCCLSEVLARGSSARPQLMLSRLTMRRWLLRIRVRTTALNNSRHSRQRLAIHENRG